MTHPPTDNPTDYPADNPIERPAGSFSQGSADSPAGLRARPIGMFDSGIGGLTVLHECLVAMPNEDFVYLGDTARFPYGPKTQDELRLFARQIATFLDDTGVKLLVVACYSATAAALPALQEQFSTPIIGVVLPGARAAVQTSRYRRIGVLATEATVASGSYVRAIGELDHGAEVIQQACPGLAAFIQDGDVASHEIVAAVRRFTAPLKERRPDVVILGCTHYPLIAPLLQRHLGRDVTLVNPAAEIAREVAEVLVRQGIDSDAEREGSYRFFCTGEVDGVSQPWAPGSCRCRSTTSSRWRSSAWRRWSTVTTRLLARGSAYAAAYVVLTLVSGAFGLASGQIQFRISEALLPFACVDPAAVVGLTLGTAIANGLTSTMGLPDVVIGSLLTLTAALLMWWIGPRVVALAAPVVVNGLGVGAELALILHLPFWPSVGFVALGEAVVLFSGGLLVLRVIRSHGALLGLPGRPRHGEPAVLDQKKR